MKINNSTPLSRMQQPDQTKVGGKPEQPGTDKTQSSPSAIAHLSQAINDSSQDIDSLRVNELKDAIRDGRLEIRADKIADSLIESVKDLIASQPE